MAKKIKWVVGAVVLAGLCYGAWSYFQPKDTVNYLTEPVGRKDLKQTVTATGEISADKLIQVGAEASGQIKKLHVKIGQQVKKGDLIAEIDSRTQTNTLNTKRAELDTFQAKLRSQQIALKSAQTQYKREKALWAEDATSKENLETAENNLAAAKASLEEIRSSIKQTQISINTAEKELGDTKITAPSDGTVVAIPVEEGQSVNAVQSTPTIVQLADLSVMLNKMQIAEGDISKVKAGMPVSFTVLSDSDKVRTGKLDSVDPGLTTMSQGSYTTSTDTTSTAIYYYARALVPNEDRSLHIGMTTENTITVNEAKNVLTVPVLAVKPKNGKRFVRVLGNKNKPVEKEIGVGLSDGTNIQVTKGLAEGEKVIVSEADANAKSNNMRGDPGGPPM
ncbi:efflux RND transporter periplasmic adaptor subunit [Neisseria chenwenguii]|uniref:Efflux transporter periplasmic adaptor subunit n=1 Tax=Neisseria chenwenguii TaxID=1853278 RepID=A0A220S3M2_9NEIS|nr:efflux RND transporter periplasmic adaptor subunit [Neisseria chenwenguii]ASK28074.1 efflux transporter periplasmic adaptor subunit [Neisseria chenwenguii]ROV57224.1 efflux RND transporter periplasmic adaptor subunit [Neisseria chenwenguii]